MVEPSTSRRSFLFGRNLKVDDPWLRFLARLRRSCEGKVNLLARDSAPLARLEPARLEDVLHALSLCREYGVCMALEGVPVPVPDRQRPVLEVEAGRAWGSLTPLGDGLWRVQAGCPIEVMRAAGLALLPVPGSVRNAAQWIAMLETGHQVGGLARYGVESVECLYPDGSIEVLGLFGVHDSQPLRSMAAQRSVPTLFQATMHPVIENIASQTRAGLKPVWPLVFRLDALMNLPGSNVSLAHLLLGHRGSLGWVVALHLRAAETGQFEMMQSAPSRDLIASVSGLGEDGLKSGGPQGSDQELLYFETPGLSPSELPRYLQQCREIEQDIKRAVDPAGVFLSCPDQTG